MGAEIDVDCLASNHGLILIEVIDVRDKSLAGPLAEARPAQGVRRAQKQASMEGRVVQTPIWIAHNEEL